MARSSLRERIADQFSGRGERAEVWRAFDTFLATDRYLNLGYSPWYLPHALGSSQRRLAVRAGRELAARLSETEAISLLDVGCGRGGPAIDLETTYGFDVTGVDLVSHNVRTAVANAAETRRVPAFVVGDATALPFQDDRFRVAAALDAFVYVADRARAFAELGRVLEDDGIVTIADLVVTPGADARDRATVETFAGAWDMAPIATVDEYVGTLRSAGFTIDAQMDISANSIDRFRKWTWLSLALVEYGTPVSDRLFAMYDLDPGPITEQVRTAHAALPSLQHRLLVARYDG